MSAGLTKVKHSPVGYFVTVLTHRELFAHFLHQLKALTAPATSLNLTQVITLKMNTARQRWPTSGCQGWTLTPEGLCANIAAKILESE